MAKETKIGLAVCVLLIGAFAFIIYSKSHKKTRPDDDLFAVSDSSSRDAPKPADGGHHHDFGGEPDPGHSHNDGHNHGGKGRGHNHGKTAAADKKNTGDDFGVPQRQRTFRPGGRNERDGFQQAGDPKKDQPPRQDAEPDDPSAQSSHQRTRREAPPPRDAAGKSEFGLEDDKPGNRRTAGTSESEQEPAQNTWDINDFLGARRRRDEPEQKQEQTAEDEEPFGLEPVETAKQEGGRHQHRHRHQPPQADEFNPFDAPAPQATDDAAQQQIQQSSGRSFEHRGRWGSEREQDSDSTTGGQSSETQNATRESRPRGLFDAPENSGSTTTRKESSGSRFDSLPPAPEPGQQRSQRQHSHEQHAQDDLSQPFGRDHSHQHGRHDRGDNKHLLPKTVEAADDTQGDRPAIHVVKSGDNFWNISKQHYQAGRYYKALAEYNKQRIPDPQKLRPGMKVLIPQAQTLEARFSALCPWSAAKPAVDSNVAVSGGRPGYFTTAEGEPRYRIGARDTLTGIARDHLGRSSRWVQVYGLNRDQIPDPGRLKIGTVLRLPADASRVELVRRDRAVR